MAFAFEIESRLVAGPDEVWSAARTMEGVNAELGPWVRMTVPRAARGLAIDAAPLGREAFRSVLLALGIVPFDVHALTLVEVGERRFLERSASLLQRLWEHERHVEPIDREGGGGSIVRDRLLVEPRLPISPLARLVVAALFRWRHLRLRARFGSR